VTIKTNDLMIWKIDSVFWRRSPLSHLFLSHYPNWRHWLSSTDRLLLRNAYFRPQLTSAELLLPSTAYFCGTLTSFHSLLLRSAYFRWPLSSVYLTTETELCEVGSSNFAVEFIKMKVTDLC